MNWKKETKFYFYNKQSNIQISYLKRTARMKVNAGSVLVNALPIVGVECFKPTK